MEKLRKTACWLLAVANLLAITGMLLIGYSDLLQPEAWPKLSNVGLLMPAAILANLGFLILWILLRPRLLWLPVAGLLLAFVPIRQYTPFNPTKEPPHGALKLLSWNVAMFEGHVTKEGEKSETMRYLFDCKADFICLQEATDKGDSLSPLKLLQKKYAYTAFIPKASENGHGLFLASRYPILSHDSIPYHSPGNMSVEFLVDVEGRKVSIINNHFQSYGISEKEREGFHHILKGDVEADTARIETILLIEKLSKGTTQRAAQVRIVAARIQQRLKEGMPIIVCGDFNDTPISYTHRTLSKGLTDCYIASGNGPGRSFNRNGIYARIDHILCSDFFKPYGAKVDGGIQTSDHNPIFCWLEMRPKP